MGTRARRITIEVGGDDVGAGKTIHGTGDDLDKLGTKLRGVSDDATKGFGGVADEADKLGTKLRTAGDKYGDALSSGISKGADGIGASLEEAGSVSSDLFASGFDVDAVADVITGKLSDLGSKGGKLMAGMAAVGVAAGAMFATGLLQGWDNEVATDRLAAQLGGSEWAQSMGEVAGDLYLDGFGESIADTGVAVKSAIQGGLVDVDSATDEQIESISGRLLTFTDVLEQDMDMTTQAISNMLRTGIAEDGTEAFDILTRGVQQGADRAGDLLETFQEYSTMFRDVGISAEEATGLMVQGLRAGARDADTVADALKEFAIRAQDGSKLSAEGFELIGLNAEKMTAAVARGGPAARDALGQVLDGLRNMEDPVARNAAAVALFGTKAEDLADSLFALDLDSAAGELGTVAGATDQLGSAYDNAKSRIETFKREALDKLVSFVGDTVLPQVEEWKDLYGDDLGRAFETVSGFIEDHEDVVRGFGVLVGGVLAMVVIHWAATAAAAVAAAVVHGAQVAFMIAKYVLLGAAALASAAQMALAWIIGLGPIGLVIAAIAALAVLVVIHFDTITAAIAAAFGWVRDNWPLLLAILTGPIGLAVLAIVRNWDTIKAGATAVRDWIVARFGDVLSFIGGLGAAIGRAASGMWDGISNAFKSAINAIIRWWNRLKIPGFDININGPGPIPDLHFSWDGLSLPNITPLAEGGIIRARPGGTLVRAGEAGVDEAYVPLDGRHDLGGDVHVHMHIGKLIVARNQSEFDQMAAAAVDRALAVNPRAVTVRGRPL